MACWVAYSIITPGVALAMVLGIAIGRAWPRGQKCPCSACGRIVSAPCRPTPAKAASVELIRDGDAVCTTCRWKAAHSPDCPVKDEPWPMIEVLTQPQQEA